MAVVAGLMARLEAETAGFHARMTAAAGQMERMGSSGVVARRGVMMIQSGLQQLTTQVAMLPGPLGRLATGFASLGLGSTMMTGVLAAGGAVVAMWRLHITVIAELERALQRLNQEFANLAARGAPNVALVTQIGQFQERMSQVQQPGLLERLTAPPAAGRGGLINLLFGDIGEAKRAGREAQLGTLQNILTVLEESLELERQNLQLSLPGRQAEAAERASRLLALNLGTRIASRLGRPSLVDTGPLPDVPALRLLPEMARTREGIRAARAQLFADQIERIEKAMQQATNAAPALAIAIIGSVQSAIAAIAGGGAGGAFAGVGGILTSLAAADPTRFAFLGVPGMILGGLGTLFGLFDRNEDARERERQRQAESRHQQLLGALRDRGEAVIVIPAGTDLSDPRFLDRLARALRELDERRIVTQAAA